MGGSVRQALQESGVDFVCGLIPLFLRWNIPLDWFFRKFVF